jgi:hypothetical protein
MRVNPLPQGLLDLREPALGPIGQIQCIRKLTAHAPFQGFNTPSSSTLIWFSTALKRSRQKVNKLAPRW